MPRQSFKTKSFFFHNQWAIKAVPNGHCWATLQAVTPHYGRFSGKNQPFLSCFSTISSYEFKTEPLVPSKCFKMKSIFFHTKLDIKGLQMRHQGAMFSALTPWLGHFSDAKHPI